ncbi:MAG: DUF2851 family protein [Chitinophagaceae bacterium]|nr:DUF2851 family protein [Chitinophagaceae bacterium]
MTEKLLQYIWQFQLYNKQQLATTSGETIEIIHPGISNTNQGPDFTNAKIKINTTTWAGNIELHLLSADWHRHKHSEDKNYGNVILHVVWQNDAELSLPFATLVLQDRVSKLLLNRYKEWMDKKSFIPCENNIVAINAITWLAWKDRLLVERLQNKSVFIFDCLQKNNSHWEETLWWLIAKNFGIKVNSDAFLSIAKSIPVNILAKHKNQIHQLEALLFGQAGLLDNVFLDDYPGMLRKEYEFYKNKYKLSKPSIQLFFLRMRPANFPTIRLAQLAMLVHKSLHLFSAIKESASLQEIRALLDITANDYWLYHYRFDEGSAYKEKKLGTQMIDNILINSVLPILFAYGHFNNEATYKDKAIQWLQEVKAEQNNITKAFQAISIENKNAFDSQALLQLKNEYCNNKRCLDCAIGNKILRIV